MASLLIRLANQLKIVDFMNLFLCKNYLHIGLIKESVTNSSKKQSVLLTVCFLLHLHDLNSKPYGVNYIARYSLCLREGIGSTFTQDVVGAIHISAYRASIFGAVQAVSPSNPFPTKDVLFLIVGCVGGNRIKINKAGLTGIALFPDFELNPHESSFVGEHVNEPRMRNGHKVLIVFPPHGAFLLPQGVLADNDRSNPVCYQEVHNPLTGGVQVVIDLSVTRVGDAFHLPGDPFAVRFGKLLFEFLHALVVPLVPRFYRTTVNQARRKALAV